MKRLFSIYIAFAILLCGTLPASAQPLADIPGAIEQDKVLGYLGQLAEWQRSSAAIEPASISPREQAYKDSLGSNALNALRAGFKFARLEASIAPAESLADPDSESPREKLRQRALAVDARVKELRLLHNANAAAELKLALAQQDLLETVQANFDAASSGGGASFSAKIGNLQRSIPELADGIKSPPSTAATDNSSGEENGLIALADRLFSIARQQRSISDYRAQSKELESTGRAMLEELRKALDTISSHATAKDADALVIKYKQVASIVAPLAEANVWVSTNQNTAGEWYKALNQRFHQTLRQLGIRIAVLLATLAVPIVLGECVERGINRYIRDPKRKRQAHTLRRAVVGIAIVLVLLLNFISDFSSFATFAGFMTAGLAVALQGVLLSLVGHFFFYGRYGVRAGDRVVVSGVTGDILQIGMMRFYLRELRENEEGELKATGKVVAFPNSILFQPSAFYKYVD